MTILTGTSGDDSLAGLDGDDTLDGGAGDDTLDGGAGADALFGQAGADLFVLRRGGGADVVGDFQAGTDQVDLRDFGLAGFAQLQAKMAQAGTDVVIGLGAGDLLLLRG